MKTTFDALLRQLDQELYRTDDVWAEGDAEDALDLALERNRTMPHEKRVGVYQFFSYALVAPANLAETIGLAVIAEPPSVASTSSVLRWAAELAEADRSSEALHMVSEWFEREGWKCVPPSPSSS